MRYFLSRSFFFFLPVAARRVFAAFGCVERRLLWMEACWATRRDVFVNPFLERSSPRQSARNNVTGSSFRFHDGNVRFAGDAKKIVRRATANQAGRAKMIR